MKLQHAGKSLTGAVVIFELCRLALALKLFVVPSDVYKCTIDPVTNPNPIYRYNYTPTRDNINVEYCLFCKVLFFFIYYYYYFFFCIFNQNFNT
jgi:hypothetical protein